MHLAAAKALFQEHTRNLSPALARRRGWVIHLIEFPIIDCAFTAPERTPLRLRLRCDNWNDFPPAVSLHAADGSSLTALQANPTGVFHQGRHPTTQRPFVCMRGVLEYHTHTSHVSDLWERVKHSSRYTLGGIITQIWDAWLKGSD